jgi:hypothetical protein
MALMRPGNLLPARTGINGLAHNDGRPARDPQAIRETLPPSGLFQVPMPPSTAARLSAIIQS